MISYSWLWIEKNNYLWFRNETVCGIVLQLFITIYWKTTSGCVYTHFDSFLVSIFKVGWIYTSLLDVFKFF